MGSFGADVESAQLELADATATGSSANIEEGVYFIRGHFVRVAKQRIILDKYTNLPSYRVGLTIAEVLETPEEDSSLFWITQHGSTNVNAKGAHRLKFTLTLSKLSLDSTDDENFVELIRVDNGVVVEKARNTEYSVIETLARRTFDESGDYTVRDFDFDIREGSANDGLNNGVYNINTTTDEGITATDDFLTMQVAPEIKPYVRGYEIETIAPKYIDIPKPRTFENVEGSITPVEVGNFVIVKNVHGQPEISPLISGEIDEPYRTIELYDTANTTRGASNGNLIGLVQRRI